MDLHDLIKQYQSLEKGETPERKWVDVLSCIHKW